MCRYPALGQPSTFWKNGDKMSINSLANAAAARRPDFPPFNSVPQRLEEIAAAAATLPTPSPGGVPPQQPPAAQSANAVNTALNLLFGYIPTEVLTLYVAVLAAIQKPAIVTRAEWITLWGFLVATPIVVWLVYGAKVKAAQKQMPVAPRTWPVWEMFAATVAYCAWAFALPNTPFASYSWYSAALSGIAVLVASTVLGLLAPFFQRPLSP
jgi:hypothetical protein